MTEPIWLKEVKRKAKAWDAITGEKWMMVSEELVPAAQDALDPVTMYTIVDRRISPVYEQQRKIFSSVDPLLAIETAMRKRP